MGAHTLSDQCISVCVCQLVCTHAIVGLCTVWPRSPPPSHFSYQISVPVDRNFGSLRRHFVHLHTCLVALFRDYPGEPVPERQNRSGFYWSKSGSGISWAICKSAPRCRQITMPAPHHSITGRMPFLPPNQQRQSTEGTVIFDKCQHQRTDYRCIAKKQKNDD